MAKTTRALIAHLYRRAAFGATPHELNAGERAGWDATVEHLLAGLGKLDESAAASTPPSFVPFVQDIVGNNPNHTPEFLSLTNWWIERMATTTTPLKEKLVLLLHCQFPTAYYKVNVPSLLFRQNVLFRQLGHGRFDVLMNAVAKDPAMLIWLDTGTDLVSHPNENFARELMERFTMGVGTFTESDVKNAARAFAGWSLNYQSGEYQLNANGQDIGWKTVLGHGGYLTGEEVVDIASRTEASARWVVSRLWSWLAYPVGTHNIRVAELAPGYRSDLDVGRLLRSILTHPEFVSSNSTQGLLKQPVEYVVGTMRAFNLSVSSFQPGYLMQLLSSLGQQLFNPPTVGGWGSNQYWLSTANSLDQLKFATSVAATADLSRIADQPANVRVEALGDLLGVQSWSSGTAATLKHVRGDTPSLVALGLVSPEFVAN